MKTLKKYSLVPLMGLLPLYAGAISDFQGLIAFFITTLNQIVPFAIGLAVVMFLFGVIKYVMAGDSDTGREGARQIMLWGIVAIFVMVSVWGLVNLFTSSFLLVTTVQPGPILPTPK